MKDLLDPGERMVAETISRVRGINHNTSGMFPPKITFGTLAEEGENDQQGKEKVMEKVTSTKVWVEGTFNNKEKGQDILNKDQASTTKKSDPVEKEKSQGWKQAFVGDTTYSKYRYERGFTDS